MALFATFPLITLTPQSSMFSVFDLRFEVVPEPYCSLESFKHLGVPDVHLQISRGEKLPVHSNVIMMFSKVLQSIVQSAKIKGQVCHVARNCTCIWASLQVVIQVCASLEIHLGRDFSLASSQLIWQA